jgi:methionyl-tRNA formyltransferase
MQTSSPAADGGSRAAKKFACHGACEEICFRHTHFLRETFAMRLVMMGTGPFAAPTFRGLYDTRHEILALVTQPPRAVHGQVQHNPMRQVAEEHGTPVLDPPDINAPSEQARLAQLAPDLFIVADYGQILAPTTLAIAPHGGINLHGSLLPKYRGAAPINWAIYNGERETGVTVIHMTPRVDAGPCLLQASTEIGPDETAPELETRLAELGAPLVSQAMELLTTGQAPALPQDPTRASRARRLRKSDGAVDWRRPAEAIRNQVRAFEPWPKTFTFWHREGSEPTRLILGEVAVVKAVSESSQPPGTILTAAGDELIVLTGDSLLALRSLQPAGKRMMSAEEFLRGHALNPGSRLGTM